MLGSILRYSDISTSYIQNRYQGAEGGGFGLSISGQVKRTWGHFKKSGSSKQGTAAKYPGTDLVVNRDGNEIENTEVTITDVTVIGAHFDHAGTQRTQISGKARLTSYQLWGYTNLRRQAKAYLLSEKCRLFLAGKFAFDPIVAALDKQKPYDGIHSTITQGDAGLLPEGAIGYYEQTSKHFEGGGVQASTASFKENTRFDVYLNPDSYGTTTLIHEALHSATKLSDVALAYRLTGIDYTYSQFPLIKSSVAISRELAAHGCGPNKNGE